jgi:hypothetical protein
MPESHTPDHERLAAEARGDLDDDLFTETGSGSLTSEGYLADCAPVTYLADDEQPHYLLAGSEGLTVRVRSGVEATDEREGVYTTTDGHRAAVLVTDTRIVFLIGRGGGNEVIDIPVQRIEAIQTDVGLMHQKLTVEDDSYEYVFNTERPANVDEAVAYIRERREESEQTAAGLRPGDHELLPEGLAEFAPEDAILESAGRGTITSVRSDLAWLTGVHASLGTAVADDGSSDDIRHLLDAVEELLSTLQAVETVLARADSGAAPPDLEAIEAAQSAAADTPLDTSRLDEIRDEAGDTAHNDRQTENSTSSSESTEVDVDTEIFGQDDPFTDPDIVGPDDPTLAEESPELKQELQRLVGSCHRIPTREDVVERAKHDIENFERYGGSWEGVLESAGFDLRDRMLDHLREIDDQCEETVTPADLLGTTYEYERYVEVFEDWNTVLDIAELDHRRGEMLAAIQFCRSELGRVPEPTELAEFTGFDSDEYIAEFGSIQNALTAAGIEDTHSDGSDASGEETSEPPVEDSNDLQRCPLSEWYDSVRAVRKLQRSIYGADLADLPENDPGAVWVRKVEAVAGASGPDGWETGYGQQHQNRVDHSVKSYRDAYGDGERVTEFSAVEVTTVPDSVALLADCDPTEEIRVPVAPESEVPLPVVVTDGSELERAEQLLAELPERPAVTDEESDLADTDYQTAETDSETSPSDTGAEPETVASDDEPSEAESTSSTTDVAASEVEQAAVEELTTVNGVDTEIAQTLIDAGYDSVDALANTNTDELTTLEGIDSGRAFRITFALDD